MPEKANAGRYKLDVPKPSTIALLFLYGFPACVAVSVSPALSAIRHHFGLSDLEVRSVMTLAMFAYALGPLFSAPMSFFLGRRKAILAGVGVSLAGFAVMGVSSLVNSYELFLLGRVVSMFGSASAFCLAYAVISDFYYEEEARGILAAIAAAFCMMPGLVMAACGQITEYLTWQLTTPFIALYALATGWLCWRLPETCPAKPFDGEDFKRIFVEYGLVLANRTFIYCALITGLAVAALYVYATDAALIAIDGLGMSAGTFGLLSLLPYLGAIVSLTFMHKFGGRMSFTATTLLGFGLIALAAVPMLIFFLAGFVDAASIFGLTFVLIAGTMPLNVTYVTIAENSTPYRGVVASLISSIFMFASMLAVQCSGLLNPYMGHLEYPATLLILLALLIVVFAAMLLDKTKGRPALKE